MVKDLKNLNKKTPEKMTPERLLRQIDVAERLGRLLPYQEKLLHDFRLFLAAYRVSPEPKVLDAIVADLRDHYNTDFDSTVPGEEFTAEIRRIVIKHLASLGEGREGEKDELTKALRDLLEQFHAYQAGWLGEGIWRTRIGLPAAMERAEKLLPKE